MQTWTQEAQKTIFYCCVSCKNLLCIFSNVESSKSQNILVKFKTRLKIIFTLCNMQCRLKQNSEKNQLKISLATVPLRSGYAKLIRAISKILNLKPYSYSYSYTQSYKINLWLSINLTLFYFSTFTLSNSENQ